MTQYLLKRLLLIIPTLLGAVTVVFVAIRLAPGDPATLLLGEFSTPEAVAQIREQYGLDQPIYVQYFLFLQGMITLDFGESYSTGRPVLDEIARVFPYSAQLALGALVTAIIIGIPAGVIAATTRRKWLEGTSMVGSLTLLSVPNFYLGIVLIMLFSVGLGLFPVTGAGDPSDPLDLLMHLILPAVALSSSSAALVARMTRSCLLEVMNADYITTARAKGLMERVVLLRHALKNAMIPVTSVLGLQLGGLLGGAVVIETVFARPGIGQLIIHSITARDYVQVQAGIIVLTFIFITVNLVTDILYGFLDPRIRYS